MIFLGLLLGMCGCNLSPSPPLLREAASGAIEIMQNEATEGGILFSTDEWPAIDWWHSFGDDQLNALVAQCLFTNPSLLATQARVKMALATCDKAHAPFFPTIDFATDITSVHQSTNGIFGILKASDPIYPVTYRQRNMAINFAYEFDFFKKHKNELEAAIDEIQATKAEAYVSALTLAISVVETYFQFQSLGAKSAAAEQIFVNKQEIANLVQQRQQEGLENRQATNNAMSALLNAEQNNLQIQQRKIGAYHALNELIAGDFVSPIQNLPYTGILEAFPIPSNLPLDLLSHRPDVWAKRWHVEAAARQICVAKAAFYPNINILGSMGFQAIKSLPLIAFGSTYGIIVGPALHLPIFEGGALQADLDLRQQQYLVALSEYDVTVLKAVREVLDAMVGLQKTKEIYESHQVAEEIAKSNFQIAVDQNENTMLTKIDLLSSNNDYLQAVERRLEAFYACLQARLELIRALGGGYEVSCDNED